MRLSPVRLFVSVVVALALTRASAAIAQPIISGPDTSAGKTDLDIPYQQGTVNYQFDAELTFNPSAGWMSKHLASPVTEGGAPLILDASQPFPLVISENFTLSPSAPDRSVSDWHEALGTKGWVWIIPGDPSFPGLFPDGQTLITRDGQPWDSTLLPNPNQLRLDIVFDPIDSGHVLDVHKALLWVGTDTQSAWGDDPSETFIQVWEYPTPEPGSLALASLATIMLVLGRKRFYFRGAPDRRTRPGRRLTRFPPTCRF